VHANLVSFTCLKAFALDQRWKRPQKAQFFSGTTRERPKIDSGRSCRL
jgi:hypothetical protein